MAASMAPIARDLQDRLKGGRSTLFGRPRWRAAYSRFSSVLKTAFRGRGPFPFLRRLLRPESAAEYTTMAGSGLHDRLACRGRVVHGSARFGTNPGQVCSCFSFSRPLVYFWLSYGEELFRLFPATQVAILWERRYAAAERAGHVLYAKRAPRAASAVCRSIAQNPKPVGDVVFIIAN